MGALLKSPNCCVSYCWDVWWIYLSESLEQFSSRQRQWGESIWWSLPVRRLQLHWASWTRHWIAGAWGGKEITTGVQFLKKHFPNDVGEVGKVVEVGEEATVRLFTNTYVWMGNVRDTAWEIWRCISREILVEMSKFWSKSPISSMYWETMLCNAVARVGSVKYWWWQICNDCQRNPIGPILFFLHKLQDGIQKSDSYSLVSESKNFWQV